MSNFFKRFTSRPFLMTLSGALSAIGLGIAAVQSKEVPPDQKIQAVIAAFGAVTVLVGTFTHAETKKDGANAVAQINAAALATQPTPDIGDLVKSEVIKHLAEKALEK